MFVKRLPDGSFASTPIYLGQVPPATLMAAHENCEHAWEDIGPATTDEIPGCAIQLQTCTKCMYAKRVHITGSKAALDAHAITLHAVELSDERKPSAN